MINSFARLIICICLISTTACNKMQNYVQKKCSGQSDKSYELTVSKIRLIDNIYMNPADTVNGRETLEFPMTLLEKEDFRDLLDSICFYKQPLIGLIADSSKNYVQKEIALYALQFLCVDDYVEAMKVVIEQFKLKRVDEYFISKIFGISEMSVEVYKNYHHPQLIKVLTDLKIHLSKGNSKERELSKRIDELLSGELWHHLRDYHYSVGFDTWYCGKKLWWHQ